MQKRLIYGALSTALAIFAGCASSAIGPLDDAATDDEPTGAIQGSDDAGPVLAIGMDAGNPRDSGRPVAAGDASAADASRPDAALHLDAAVDAARPSGSTAKDAALAPVDARIETMVPVVDAAQPAPPVAPDGCATQMYQQHAYFFCTQTLSWVSARATCLTAGLDLAIVDDQAESTFLAGNDESWIGETDLDTEGKYLDVVPGDAQRTDGAAISFVHWDKGEPSNTKTCTGVVVLGNCLGKVGSDEDCMVVRNNGYFNDDACDTKKRFVCEQH